jgi:hypothetical protein
MTYDEFSTSLTSATPPEKLSPYLQALWYDGKNNWDKAHEIAQDINDKDGAWLHAYLHRKEGDTGNAGYWYRRAGKSMPAYSLEQEWKEMVKSFL